MTEITDADRKQADKIRKSMNRKIVPAHMRPVQYDSAGRRIKPKASNRRTKSIREIGQYVR